MTYAAMRNVVALKYLLGISMMGLYYFFDLPEQLKDSNWELGEQSLGRKEWIAPPDYRLR